MENQDRARWPAPLGRVPLPALPEPARASAADDDGARVHVRAFRFSDNTAIDGASLAVHLDDLVGRELSLKELNAAADRITALYRRRGFLLATAYLPAQDIADGVVRIALLEGRLGKVKLDNRSRVSESALLPLLSALTPGTPLSSDELERSLLLVKGLAGVEVQSTLTPGASTGSADLDIRVDGLERSSASLSLDNYGNRFSAEWRAGAAWALNNPLALGDVLSLRLSSGGAPFGYGRLAYQLPLGGRGLQAGAAWSAMRYRLGQDFAALQARGDASIASAYALYPLMRSRSTNLTLQGNLEHKRLNDRSDSTQTRSSKTLELLTLGISGDRADALGGGGFSTASLSYISGHLQLDSEAQALDSEGHRSAGRYGKWSWQLARQQALPSSSAAWSLLAQFSGQYSANGKNLDSSEKFGLGGAQGVRAYPQGEASCDDAWLASLELRYSAAPTLQLSAFADAAAGRLNHAPLATDRRNAQRLSGLGLGANFKLPQGLVWTSSLAWRSGSLPQSDRDRSPRFWTGLQQSI